MKRLLLASCVALLVLAPMLAFAQSRTPPAGATSSGTATARGGESGSSSSGNVSSGSSSSSGGSATTGGYSGPAGSIGTGPGGYSAPSAISRNSGVRSGESSGRVRGGDARGTAGIGQPVPGELRPRGDTPTYGRAVPRGTPIPGKGAGNSGTGAYPTPMPYGWDSGSSYTWLGYYPYGYYGSYGYYDGMYGPWSSAYYGYTPYLWLSPWNTFGEPYLWSSAGGGVYSQPETGGIRFNVKPKDAEVWVDGFFEGPVSAYDGRFEGLKLKGGTHKVEIKAKGYETLVVDVRVMPGRNVTYSGELKSLAVK